MKYIATILIIVSLMCSAFIDSPPQPPMKIFESGLKIKSVLYNDKNEIMDSTIITVDSMQSVGSSFTCFAHSVLYNEGDVFKKQGFKYDCIDKDYEPGLYGAVNSIQMLTLGKPDENSKWLHYPLDMKVGDTLPGVNVVVIIDKLGQRSVIDQVKVTGYDTITTPAGEFPSFVITYRETDSFIGLKGMPSTSTHQKEWFSLDYGVVSWEQRADGKLRFRSELVSIKH